MATCIKQCTRTLDPISRFYSDNQIDLISSSVLFKLHHDRAKYHCLQHNIRAGGPVLIHDDNMICAVWPRSRQAAVETSGTPIHGPRAFIWSRNTCDACMHRGLGKLGMQIRCPGGATGLSDFVLATHRRRLRVATPVSELRDFVRFVQRQTPAADMHGC